MIRRQIAGFEEAHRREVALARANPLTPERAFARAEAVRAYAREVSDSAGQRARDVELDLSYHLTWDRLRVATG